MHSIAHPRISLLHLTNPRYSPQRKIRSFLSDSHVIKKYNNVMNCLDFQIPGDAG